MKPLVPHPITLSEWNADRERLAAERMEQFHHPERFENGLRCDKCGGALYDTNQVMQASPVLLRVKCKSCGTKGVRRE